MGVWAINYFNMLLEDKKQSGNNDQLYLTTSILKKILFRNFGLNKFKINVKYYYEKKPKKILL